MRAVLLVLALAVGLPLHAQEEKKPPAAKRPPAAAKKAHQKPSKDQIRKFNDLEKKQK